MLSQNERRRFLKAILGGTLGLASSAWIFAAPSTQASAKCGVPCAYCRGTCQVERGHAGNHVCENLHTWHGPRPVEHNHAVPCEPSERH